VTVKKSKDNIKMIAAVGHLQRPS